jgi:hypothetical protein
MLESYGVITSLTPSCKWTFPQPYEGGVHIIEGQNGKELVGNLLDFRLKARLPIGDPEREVAEYIKRESPNNARFAGTGHRTRAEKKPVSTFTPLIERIRTTMTALIDAKPRFVSEDEADERAKACVGCTHNVAWRVKDCGPCNSHADYLALVLRQRHSYKGDAFLGACRLHDLHLGSGVFLDRDFLPARNEQSPAPCWIGATPKV